jgi:zinc/manganese transport system substrate-binding protein
VTIADVLGARGRNANPHLWYDVRELGRIGRAIADALETADSAHAGAYRRGLARFDASLGPLRLEVARIRSSFAGTPVAYTEPVPAYLLEAAGLRNLAPAAFTRAIEEGTEPSPEALNAMNQLVRNHAIKVLLYNDQAVSPITSRVRAAAEKSHIPVIGVSETLPPHRSFQQWQLAQARQLAAALAR